MALLMFSGTSLDAADAMKDGSKVTPACFLRHFGICKRSPSHCAKISTSGCKDAFRKQRIIDPADCDDRDIHDRFQCSRVMDKASDRDRCRRDDNVPGRKYAL